MNVNFSYKMNSASVVVLFLMTVPPCTGIMLGPLLKLLLSQFPYL